MLNIYFERNTQLRLVLTKISFSKYVHQFCHKSYSLTLDTSGIDFPVP